MSLKNWGTAHLFGIDTTVSNATLTDDNFEDVMKNMAEVVDEIGNVINKRMDDLTTTGTVTLIQRSAYTAPAVGTALTYNAVAYKVMRVGRKKTSRGFRVTELGLEASEYCAST